MFYIIQYDVKPLIIYFLDMYDGRKYEEKPFNIKWLKNSRKIKLDLKGNELDVIAFGCFEFDEAALKTKDKINTIIEGFEQHSVKHILTFEANKNLLVRSDKFYFETSNNSNCSEKIFYDDFCATKNYHTFSLQQFYYLLVTAIKSAGQHALGLHCQAGIGRTGTALLALQTLSLYYNAHDFFHLSPQHIFDLALNSFSQKNQDMIDINHEQKQSLYDLIADLQNIKNKKDIARILEQRLACHENIFQQQDIMNEESPLSEYEKPLTLELHRSRPQHLLIKNSNELYEVRNFDDQSATLPASGYASTQIAIPSWKRRVLGVFCGCFFSIQEPVAVAGKISTATPNTAALTIYKQSK